MIEEGRLRTTPEAFRRRFASEQQSLRIAIEAGTHSPWVSRVLKECGHEVLVANPRKLTFASPVGNCRGLRSALQHASAHRAGAAGGLERDAMEQGS